MMIILWTWKILLVIGSLFTFTSFINNVTFQGGGVSSKPPQKSPSFPETLVPINDKA